MQVKLGQTTKSRITLTAFGVIIIALALVLFVIMPLLGKISSVRDEILSSKLAVEEITTEIENYQAVIAEFERIETGREKIARMFPLRDEMVFLVEGLESVLAQAGASSDLSITDQTEQPPVRTAPGSGAAPAAPLVAGLLNAEEVPYELTVNSSYRGLVDFFLGFENLPFVSEITVISVKADQVQNQVTETLNNTGTATTKLNGVFFIRNAVN